MARSTAAVRILAGYSELPKLVDLRGKIEAIRDFGDYLEKEGLRPEWYNSMMLRHLGINEYAFALELRRAFDSGLAKTLAEAAEAQMVSYSDFLSLEPEEFAQRINDANFMSALAQILETVTIEWEDSDG